MIDLKLIAETIKSVAMISGAVVQITDAIGLTDREPVVQQVQAPQQPTVVYYCQQPPVVGNNMIPMVQQPIQNYQMQPAFGMSSERSIFSSPIPAASDKSDFDI